MRGKECYAGDGYGMMRITPACAGKRLYAAQNKTTKKDHPRVCGEKALNTVDKIADVGSPPRVRGKEAEAAVFVSWQRITPACAGKRITYKSKRN